MPLNPDESNEDGDDLVEDLMDNLHEHNGADDDCPCELCREAQVFHDPGSLEDCFWLWRERLKLFEVDDMVERLAQEASLFLISVD